MSFEIFAQIEDAEFDCRAFTVSDGWEAFNSVYWRQTDASKNSIQMVAQSLFSHKELQGKSTKNMLDMLQEK